MNSSDNTTPIVNIPSWIPEGYQLIVGPDGKEYIMPDFAIPALEQEVQAEAKKSSLNASNALGTVSNLL